MRKLVFSIGALMGALLVPHVAHAHLFTCNKTVNGTNYVEISAYPATLTYDVTVTNAAEEASEVLGITDNILASLGYSFEPAPPFTLQVGESVSDSYEVVLENEQACLDLDAADGSPDGRIDNVFQVTWVDGATQCWATAVCGPPPEEPPPEEPPPEEPPPEEPPACGVTRSPGFFKTHPEALAACIDAGPITLGSITIESIEAALGLLWSSPAAYDSGEHRSRIDRTRFKLARHALVATCNERLFGSTAGDLLAQVNAALTGTDCALMHQLKDALDAFNNSGHDEDFCEGFDAGPATPREASAMADDPTTPSSDVCDGGNEDDEGGHGRKRGEHGDRHHGDKGHGGDGDRDDDDGECDCDHDDKDDEHDDWDDHDHDECKEHDDWDSDDEWTGGDGGDDHDGEDTWE